jgi:hypothetical protein
MYKIAGFALNIELCTSKKLANLQAWWYTVSWIDIYT